MTEPERRMNVTPQLIDQLCSYAQYKMNEATIRSGLNKPSLQAGITVHPLFKDLIPIPGTIQSTIQEIKIILDMLGSLNLNLHKHKHAIDSIHQLALTTYHQALYTDLTLTNHKNNH